MRDIYSVFNSNGAYETGAHAHDEFMLMVPEHGLLRFKDEDSGRSTSVVDRQFVLVPPQCSHSSSSLTACSANTAAMHARPWAWPGCPAAGCWSWK
jgi:hypothetical protein